MSIEAWSAWGVWAQVFAVAIAGVVAIWQLRATSAIRKEAARAYVVVYFDCPEGRRHFPDLVVVNLGQTAATNVRISFTPQLQSSINDELHEVGMFLTGIPTLVPGQQLSTLFDSMLERPTAWEDSYRANVRYFDAFGVEHEDLFVVDLGPYKKSHWIERKSVHDIHERLKGIETEIKHLRAGFGGPMPVVFEGRRTHIERQASERAASQRVRSEREVNRVAQRQDPSVTEVDGDE